jgi:hypothetical protein
MVAYILIRAMRAAAEARLSGISRSSSRTFAELRSGSADRDGITAAIHLWGDVPMGTAVKVPGLDWNRFKSGDPNYKGEAFNTVLAKRARRTDPGLGTRHSKSNARKASAAAIAKIPFPLASHIARVYKPD